ncbi:MAG: helix-turn-helix transcriptional regulator [Prevotella sp.]|nr:helix-turn-helix transcriptional regulator [Prevotella sp.]
MKDRIRLVMESQHMTQQVFAEFIGTTSATLSGIFNDRTRPTLSIVELIKKKLPAVSTDWLLFGTGDMYQQAGTPVATGGQRHTAPQNATAPRQVETVLDFGDDSQAPLPASVPPVAYGSAMRVGKQEYIPEYQKVPEKPPRRVTEIRVYYDDQTWESFTPSKK